MLEAAAVFLGFAALGLAGMAPSVTFGDAGEFAAAAAALALPHAPSYPSYVVLAKALGTALPLGNWAYRTDLFSALAGAAALAILGDALRLAGCGRLPRWGAVTALGLSSLWRYSSGVTEVFALHALALASLLWLACRFSGRFWEDRPMAALGLLCGLALGNHQTFALAVPAALAQGWLAGRPSGRRLARGLAVAGLFLALGLSIYLFLPLRASRVPPLDWGHPVDLPRFLHVFLRKDYGSLSLTVEGQASGSRMAASAAQALRFLRGCRTALGAPFLALAAVGAIVWRRAGLRTSLWFPAAWIALTGPAFLCLGNPPFDAQTSGALERFFLAPCLGLALLGAAALHWLWRKETAWRFAAVVLAVLSAAPGASSSSHWLERDDFAAYDYGRSVMKSLPPGASLYMDGGDDTFYAMAFLDYAQGLRTDLDLHDRGGLVFSNPYGWNFRGLSAKEKEDRRKAVESVIAGVGLLYYSTFKDKIIEGYDLQPWGLLKKAVSGPAAFAPGLWALYPYRWSDETLAAHYRDRALVALYPLLRGASAQALGRGDEGLAWLRLAWDMGADVLWIKPNASYYLGVMGFEASGRRDWRLAESALSLARRIAPDNAQALLNLGVVFERTGRPEQAERNYQAAAALEPDSAQAYYDLGALYWGRKRWTDSARAFERAAALRPGDASLRRWAAEARSKAR